MKKLAGMMAILIMLIALAACGGAKGSGLLSNASPETSALTLYRYDGEQVTSRTVYDTARVQAIIDELNALEAKPLDSGALEDWTLPCYGLWIGGRDGMDNLVAWCGGVWLDQNGNVWRTEADFKSYWKQLEKEDEETGLTVLNFPNAGLMGAYDQRFWKPAGKAEPAPDAGGRITHLPLGMDMTVEDVTDGIATVRIDNQSGYVMSFSEYYSLQKEVGGMWYELPVTKTNIGFIDIAYELQDLEQATVTCDLTIFGDLSPGRYRLVKDDMTAEFSLP